MKHTDQTLAKQLLKLRGSDYSPWKLGVLARRQLLRFLVIGLLVYMKVNSDLGSLLESALIFSIGMIIGAIINDIAFVFRISKAWPFTKKVTDWDLVEKMANSEQENSKH